MRLYHILPALAALSPLPGFAQEAPAREELALKDAIARALANQPGLRAAGVRVDAAEAQVDRARVARRPNVGVSVGAAAQPGSAEDPAVSAGASAGLDASILLYDFGKS